MRYWLVVLSGLVLGIGFGLTFFELDSPQVKGDRRGLRYFHAQAAAAASALRAYEKSEGHYPSNDEGLSAVADAVKRRVDSDRTHGGQLAHCRVTVSGVLTWWGDPIICESRRGFSPGAFDWSGANLDRDRKFSCRVDEDIYVWSVGARDASARWTAILRRQNVTTIVVLIVSAALLAAFVATGPPSGKQLARYQRALRVCYRSLYGLFLVTIIGLVPLVLMPGFYHPARQLKRTPQLTREYTGTMRTYRDHGVITGRTYDSIVRRLAQDEKDKAYSSH